jgi:cbb3-type cytochrome oxidase subunit 3
VGAVSGAGGLGAALPYAQVATLLFFLAVFLGLVVWLLRPGAGAGARRDAEIPFREDHDRRRPTARGGVDRGRGDAA